MSRLQLKLSERQQVVAIIVASVLVVAAVSYYVVAPQIRDRRFIETQLRALRTGEYADMSKPDLQARVKEVETNLKQVRKEWAETRDRLNTYTRSEGLIGVDEIHRIDFVTELLGERDRLRSKSIDAGVELIPADLGMREAIRSGGEPAKILMLKLRAIEKMADLVIAHNIDSLVAVKPLPVVRHRDRDARGNEHVFLEEYPVRVEFDMTLDTLYELFRAVFEENNVFVFKRLRINAGANEQKPLRVGAVLSAIVLYEEPRGGGAAPAGGGKGRLRGRKGKR